MQRLFVIFFSLEERFVSFSYDFIRWHKCVKSCVFFLYTTDNVYHECVCVQKKKED